MEAQGVIDKTKLLKIYTGDNYLSPSTIKRIMQSNRKSESFQQLNAQTNAEGCRDEVRHMLPGCCKISKSPSSPYAYFTFADENSLNRAKAFLSSIRYKGCDWIAVMIEPRDLDEHRRISKGPRKREETPTSEKEHESVARSVSPWEAIPYDQQIKRKNRHCLHVLKRIHSEVSRHSFKGEVQPSNQFSYQNIWHGVTPSVQVEGYRNRVDYSIGYRGTSLMPCIGFNKGNYKQGYRTVTEISPCKITPKVFIDIAEKVEKWLQHWWSKHPTILSGYNKEKQYGFWRRLSLRKTSDGEIMLVMQTMSKSWLTKVLSDNDNSTPTQELNNHDFFCALQDEFSHRFSSMCTSLQWQEFDGVSNAAPLDCATYVIHGPKTLSERLCGDLLFRISASSFFQVNTPTFESLVLKLKKIIKEGNRTILIDMCAGSGVYGLALHKDCISVIGVDISAEAIDCARATKAQLHADNVQFLCCRVEDATSRIQSIVSEIIAENQKDGTQVQICAIVDPPRNGLHSTVLKWLRKFYMISTVVYISCDQTALINDAVHLMKPASLGYPGNSFSAKYSLAWDFFPQTSHVEMMLILERQISAAKVLSAEKE